MEEARARKTDPETSHIAAEKMNRGLARSSQADYVFSALRDAEKLEAGSWGWTAAELATKCDLTHSQIARRLPELRREGRVYQGEPRTCKETKSSCLTWFTVKPPMRWRVKSERARESDSGFLICKIPYGDQYKYSCFAPGAKFPFVSENTYEKAKRSCDQYQGEKQDD